MIYPKQTMVLFFRGRTLFWVALKAEKYEKLTILVLLGVPFFMGKGLQNSVALKTLPRISFISKWMMVLFGTLYTPFWEAFFTKIHPKMVNWQNIGDKKKGIKGTKKYQIFCDDFLNPRASFYIGSMHLQCTKQFWHALKPTLIKSTKNSINTTNVEFMHVLDKNRAFCFNACQNCLVRCKCILPI